MEEAIAIAKQIAKALEGGHEAGSPLSRTAGSSSEDSTSRRRGRFTNDDEMADFPVFSPDGEWVAYISVLNEEMRKVSVRGGTSLAVAALEVPLNSLEGIQGMEWTGDDTIVYTVETGVMRVPSGGGTPATRAPPACSKSQL